MWCQQCQKEAWRDDYCEEHWNKYCATPIKEQPKLTKEEKRIERSKDKRNGKSNNKNRT